MMKNVIFRAGAVSALLTLAGCASSPGGIYVPIGGGDQATAPPPPKTTSEPATSSETTVWRKSELPEESAPAPVPRETTTPSYRDAGESLSPAALSLVNEAEGYLQRGDTSSAISRLERAQRIAPRSAEVYFKLSEAYVANDQLGTAEQFTLKGLSVAGNDTRLQRAGWMLLADIRRARGNVAGADQAEARASAL
ncbi:tetratricopeptide repeat protein [Marinobacter salinexigens]|uniref:Tetratricopeptide repeat protein n=1 Tax=Marinobacter salinexigens TaxID=2919747 RepID=A0A5B0V818_9GAMM|nr:tetratricopeptide repeat protein [Marinobacter salinexigens]KAA1170697.1 tetratricopeptide repeat protein [Marinobacter salinexigens]